MAVDMFLKIEGVTGECKDSKHQDWIDILAWSWGMTQSGSMHIGGGGGSGKVNMQDLSLTKYVDKSSSDCFLNCCSGKHFPKVTLEVNKAGGDNPVNYYKMELTDVLVSSFQTGGSGGEDRITENITFNFAKVKTIYTPQDSKGAGQGAITQGWDVEANKKL